MSRDIKDTLPANGADPVPEVQFLNNGKQPEYDVEALKKNVERIDNNIKSLNEAIQKEMEAKAELNQLIKGLEKE